MDMHGIKEDSDDFLERDYSADPVLHSSNHLNIVNYNNNNTNKHQN
jgi:hypothetical protein